MPPSSSGEAAPEERPAFTIRWIFLGPNGTRAGWRIAIYLALVVALTGGLQLTVRHIAPLRAWLAGQPNGVLAAGPSAVGEIFTFLTVLIPAVIMSKIENRSFGVYGLPLKEAFGARFWLGLPYGFAMMTLLAGSIAALHGFTITGIGASGVVALKYGILYAIAFLFTGFFEEFGFRGYLQYTLASGIGFWPAALVLSFLFGAGHLGNPGEAKIGAVMAGSFGLLALFALRRTGSLWFAVGMHAGFDWTETFFYGVPDSGLLAQGHLLNSSLQGRDWLTGGTVGPEGSYLVFGVLILAAVGIHLMFPAREHAA
jgi:uncharacterized protein